MIFWEVEGEQIEIPAGEVDASSSSESTSSATWATTAATVVADETVQSREEARAAGASTSESASSTQSAANGGDTFDKTHSATESASMLHTADGLTRSSSMSSESSAATHEQRATEASVDGGDYIATVRFSQTVEGASTREVTIEEHRTYITTVGTGTATSTATSSSSSLGTTSESDSWSITTENSTTISRSSPGSASAQTSLTYEETLDATTHTTGSLSTTAWTTDASSAYTTTVTKTGTVTASTTLTQTGYTTTVTTGTLRAGYLRNTIILADCGMKLLVASARAGEEQAHAREWFADVGTSYLAAQDVGATFDNLLTTTTAADSSLSTDSSSDEATIFGQVVLRTFETHTEAASSMEGSTAQTAGRLVPNDGGWPVGWRSADWAFDFPPFGESGALSIRYTGPITLIVTLNPGLGAATSVSTLEDAASVEGTWTFAPGIDVAVDACEAFSPDMFADGQFYPWYVAEVPCRPHA